MQSNVALQICGLFKTPGKGYSCTVTKDIGRGRPPITRKAVAARQLNSNFNILPYLPQ